MLVSRESSPRSIAECDSACGCVGWAKASIPPRKKEEDGVEFEAGWNIELSWFVQVEREGGSNGLTGINLPRDRGGRNQHFKEWPNDALPG
jgi:hypothetical protein